MVRLFCVPNIVELVTHEYLQTHVTVTVACFTNGNNNDFDTLPRA